MSKTTDTFIFSIAPGKHKNISFYAEYYKLLECSGSGLLVSLNSAKGFPLSAGLGGRHESPFYQIQLTNTSETETLTGLLWLSSDKLDDCRVVQADVSPFLGNIDVLGHGVVTIPAVTLHIFPANPKRKLLVIKQAGASLGMVYIMMHERSTYQSMFEISEACLGGGGKAEITDYRGPIYAYEDMGNDAEIYWYEL